MTDSNLVKRIEYFIEDCGEDFDYPLGGNSTIPMGSELDLLECSERVSIPELELLKEIQYAISIDGAYNLATFSIRMAVYSLRKWDLRLLHTSLWGVCVDRDLIDWRDIIIALSIIEDCTVRLGGNLREMIDFYNPLISERRKRTIYDGYFSRSTELRSVKVMGYQLVSIKNDFTYVKI